VRYGTKTDTGTGTTSGAKTPIAQGAANRCLRDWDQPQPNGATSKDQQGGETSTEKEQGAKNTGPGTTTGQDKTTTETGRDRTGVEP